MNALAPPSVVEASNKPVLAPTPSILLYPLLPPTLVHDSVKKKRKEYVAVHVKTILDLSVGKFYPPKIPHNSHAPIL